MPELKRELTKEDVTPTCQNCDFEYYCRKHKNKPCPSWRSDLDYRRMLESCRK